MNSALDVSTTEAPEQIMSKDEFWQATKQNQDGWGFDGTHYNDWFYNFAKFFGEGQTRDFESKYEAYVNDVNNRNEARATQSARAYDEFMENTKYQRTFEDLKRVGINPYLLVNGGATPAVGSANVTKASYSRPGLKEAKSNASGRDFALILLAIARLAAAL